MLRPRIRSGRDAADYHDQGALCRCPVQDMSDDPIKNMRERVEKCRRLAATITDTRAASILRQMADEGSADIARLTAEFDKRAASQDP